MPISSITLKPGDPNTAVIATYGREVWTYVFDRKIPVPVEQPPAPAPAPSVGQAYADGHADDGFAFASSGPTGYG